MTNLFDFAVMTIFAREFLEGSIIIGEYRTIILLGDNHVLQPGVRRQEALRAVTLSALVATALALMVIAAVAIPLALLSHQFDDTTAKLIEGSSKIVAGLCLLQLSLKLPKFLGLYASSKKRAVGADGVDEEEQSGLSLRSIRFNVAWNIWREVAECGVFLIPVFLSGDGLAAVPLSALIGSVAGLAVGGGIYYANKQFTNKVGLCVFAVLVLVFLSAGLLTSGCHSFETELGLTKEVWAISPPFWSVNRLPMTILKPFGYSDSRTVLEIVIYWSWLAFSGLLHYRKYKRAPRVAAADHDAAQSEGRSASSRRRRAEDMETLSMGEGFSLSETTSPSCRRGDDVESPKSMDTINSKALRQLDMQPARDHCSESHPHEPIKNSSASSADSFLSDSENGIDVELGEVMLTEESMCTEAVSEQPPSIQARD